MIMQIKKYFHYFITNQRTNNLSGYYRSSKLDCVQIACLKIRRVLSASFRFAVFVQAITDQLCLQGLAGNAEPSGSLAFVAAAGF